jgi:hypothetical protein
MRFFAENEVFLPRKRIRRPNPARFDIKIWHIFRSKSFILPLFGRSQTNKKLKTSGILCSLIAFRHKIRAIEIHP